MVVFGDIDRYHDIPQKLHVFRGNSAFLDFHWDFFELRPDATDVALIKHFTRSTMGYIHFFRSGGVKQSGKTVLASMLMEYLRIHQIPAYYIDSQSEPKMGLYYSHEQNSGKSRIYFDPRDITRADRLVDLSIDAEVVVDLPANLEDVANEWISGLPELLQNKTIKVADWFLFTYSRAAWETHLRQVAFWEQLDVTVPQIFFLPSYLYLRPNSLPWNAEAICLSNQIPMVYLPSPQGVALDDRPIREILDSARYPHNVSLNQWSAEIFKLFKLTQFFKEHERLEPDYKSAKTTRELVAIAKAHLFQGNLQPKQGVKKDIDNPPW